ncbi:MAG: septation protein SepH [Ornithinimicrobium sp.]
MDQLRFTGLHEDGAHLVVTSAEGSDFAVPIDDRIRAALRQSAAEPISRSGSATPREVQTQIRAGLSAEEVAGLTEWTVERVQRYEGPIVAEREHIAALARRALVRTHDRTSPPPTLESRVHERLRVRGVDLEQVRWDSMRPDGGQWSVVVRFMAGQRIRQAAWSFDLSARSVDAIDDEARWLSEDEQSLPAGAPAAAVFGGGMDGPDDLMATMRERSRRRGQGHGRQRKGAAQPNLGAADSAQDAELEVTTDPSAVPGGSGIQNEALPLEDLHYDPDTMGPPPAAGRAESPEAGDEDIDDLSEGNSYEGSDYEGNGYERDETEGADESDGADLDAHEEREATLADFFGDDEDDEDEEDEEEGEDSAAGGDESDNHSPPAEGQTSSAAGADSSSSRARKGRPSVPSWDDIMFGARDRGR